MHGMMYVELHVLNSYITRLQSTLFYYLVSSRMSSGNTKEDILGSYSVLLGFAYVSIS